MLKIGDRIKYTGQLGNRNKTFTDIKGKIIMTHEQGIYRNYLIEFNSFIDGHDGVDDRITGKDGYCWWIGIEDRP
jgi:hypothetical protein